jgi:hypothetical protein
VDNEAQRRAAVLATRALLFGAVVLFALGTYALFASVVWYPSHWPEAAIVLGVGVVLVPLSRIRLRYRFPPVQA